MKHSMKRDHHGRAHQDAPCMPGHGNSHGNLVHPPPPRRVPWCSRVYMEHRHRGASWWSMVSSIRMCFCNQGNIWTTILPIMFLFQKWEIHACMKLHETPWCTTQTSSSWKFPWCTMKHHELIPMVLQGASCQDTRPTRPDLTQPNPMHGLLVRKRA